MWRIKIERSDLIGQYGVMTQLDAMFTHEWMVIFQHRSGILENIQFLYKMHLHKDHACN